MNLATSPRWTRGALAIAGAVTLAGALAAPATATAAPAAPTPPPAATERPDLQASVKFDRATYKQGDSATVTVTVKNAGKAAATGVRTSYHKAGIDQPAADSTVAPFDLAVAETKTLSWAGAINAEGFEQGSALVRVTFTANIDANDKDNVAVATAAVPGATGNLRGTVFQTRAGLPTTGQPGLAGVQLTLKRLPDNVVHGSGTTAADGTFSFRGVPVGPYILILVAPKGWITSQRWPATVKPGDNVVEDIPAFPGDPKPGDPKPGDPKPGDPKPGDPKPGDPKPPGATPTPTPTATATASPGPLTTPVSGRGGGKDTGALPLTGVQAGVFGGVGLALVAAGVAAYLVARRRKTRFVAGE